MKQVLPVKVKESILKSMCNYCSWYLKFFGMPGYPTMMVFVLAYIFSGLK